MTNGKLHYYKTNRGGNILEDKYKTMTTFNNFTFNHLTHLQVGKIGEYWAKIWITLAGFDIYTTDVDDKGIDFIIRIDNNKYIDVQVKTIRGKSGYVFATKDSWKKELRDNLYLALVLLNNNEMPSIYLIPSTVWKNPTALFTDRNYNKEEQKSKPEWGINISKKNMEELRKYEISEWLLCRHGSVNCQT